MIEVTLVAVTVGFGAPQATAVLAVIGYRVVNSWLPLILDIAVRVGRRHGPEDSQGT